MRTTKYLIPGLALMAAVTALPSLAKADRWDSRNHGGYDHRDDRDRHDDRGRSGGYVNIRIGEPAPCPPPVVERTTQVWVDPVYRDVCDRVWVEPVYREVTDRVWREPVVQKRTVRVWIPEHREWKTVGYGMRARPQEVCVPGHWEDQCKEIVVAPGRYDNVCRKELVCEGHWQENHRQELVSAGHWETRVEQVVPSRVVMAPPHDEVRIGLNIPVRW